MPPISGWGHGARCCQKAGCRWGGAPVRAVRRGRCGVRMVLCAPPAYVGHAHWRSPRLRGRSYFSGPAHRRFPTARRGLACAWLASGPHSISSPSAVRRRDLAAATGVFSPTAAPCAPDDSPLRCDAIGMDLARLQWAAFVLVGMAAGLAGSLYAFSGAAYRRKRSRFRVRLTVWYGTAGRVQTVSGPVVGAPC